jgi:hypothetical protein
MSFRIKTNFKNWESFFGSLSHNVIVKTKKEEFIVKKIILGIVIAGAVLVFGGCALTLFTANEVVEEVDKVVQEEVQKTEDKNAMLEKMLEEAGEPVVTRDEWTYTVEYTLTNNTGVDFDYIEVQYDVFDAEGVKLGNNFTNITDVTDGQKFKVTLDLYQEGAETYEITSISSSVFE